MNEKKLAVTIAIVVGIVAIATPIAISVYWSWKQSYDEQMARIGSIADDVLRRSEQSTDQTFIAFRALEAANSPEPCSESNLRLMRRLEAENVHIKRIGYAVGNTLVCSSAGMAGPGGAGVDMGPPTYDSGVGTVIRPSVQFPFLTSGVRFLVSTHKASGYAAMIHPDLPLQVALDSPDVSVGVFSRISKKRIVSRGAFEDSWVGTADRTSAVEFAHGTALVAIRPSAKYTFSAYASVPVTRVNEGLRRTATVLVPIGLIFSALLAWAVFHLAKQQLALPTVLKVALRRNEFFLNYQPIMDLRTGECVGAEALIRWRRPNGEMVPPDAFIPVAETTGLIHDITKRVMDIVAMETAQLLKARPELHIGINLSYLDLQTDDTSHLIKELIRKMGVQPHNVLVEATERGFMEADVARRIMDDIHALKIQIAIDDFGTGYSSLSYLEKFKLDYLKIDKSFVDTMGGEAATSQVAQHIIEMAKSLKLEMIAEGVETAAQAAFLRERGVQYGQGWFFGKPMRFTDFEAFVHRTNQGGEEQG